MNIAHFTNTYFPSIGGAQIAIHNLAKLQTSMGHNVTVISPYQSLPFKKITPYNIISFPRNLRFSKLNQFSLSRNLFRIWIKFVQSRLNLDIFHFHHAMPLYGIDILKSHKFGIILTSHGSDIQTNSSLFYGNRLTIKFDNMVLKSLPQCDGLVAINKNIFNEFVSLGCKKENIFEIINGVDFNRIQKLIAMKYKYKLQIFSQFNLKFDSKLLISIGRNHPIKGYSIVPELLNLVSQKFNNFTWILIGRDCEPIMDEAKKMHVSNHLKIVDELRGSLNTNSEISFPSDDLIKLLSVSDLFVFPTLMEGCPLVVLEAMACGIPIVSNDTIGIRDIISNGDNGLLSPIGNHSEMANNIINLLNNKILYTRIKEKGLEFAQQNTWEAITKQYLNVYDHVIKRMHSNNEIT